MIAIIFSRIAHILRIEGGYIKYAEYLANFTENGIVCFMYNCGLKHEQQHADYTRQKTQRYSMYIGHKGQPLPPV